MDIDETQLARIEKQLRTDHVYVDPTMKSAIRPDVLAKVTALAKDSRQPTNVVVTPLSYDDPDFHGRSELLSGTLHSDLGGDAAYIMVVRSSGGETPTVSSTGYGVDDVETASYAAEELHPHDPSAQLLETAQLLHDGNARDVYDQLVAARNSPSTTPTTGTTDTPVRGHDQQHTSWGAIVFPVVLLAVVLTLLIRARVRRRGRLPNTAHDAVTARPFTLPVAVLGHIRAAQEADTAKRAEREVLALGERIDETELTPWASTASWQAVLDHYDLARRILDGPHGPADVVGAIVLAERGENALAAATAGRAYHPQTPCFFNPLHGTGTPTNWDGAAGHSTVPMCAQCARAVRDGGRPDVLDFLVDGKAQHYYDLDLEPWSSTGYGALTPDLTDALFARRPRRSGRRSRRRRRHER